MPEIKERVNRLKGLADKLKGQAESLKGAEGEALKKKAKKQGIQIGVGAGTSILGLMIAWVASLYILYVIILAVDTGLHRPWLSALIVVGATLIIGGVILAIGALIAKKGAEELPKSIEAAVEPLKETGEELKAEAEELQKLAKAEAEARQQQVMEMVASIKANAQIIGPAAGVAFLIAWWMKRRLKIRKARKLVFKILDKYREKVAEDAEGNEGDDIVLHDLFEDD